MITNNSLGQRQERASLAFDLLALSRLAGANGIPILYARWRIAGAAVLALPTYGVDIFSTAKESAKQLDLFLGWGFL